jgi:hypothetical protein
VSRPQIAHAWAVQRRALLNDAPAHDEWQDDHSNDPRWSAVARLADSRAKELASAATETQQAIASLWIERVDGGYLATTLHPLEGEFALLADVGLQHMIDVNAMLVARHYREPSFDASHCTDAARSAFARLYHSLIGQFYLYGRLRYPLPFPLLGPQPLAERVAQEAALFVLAHELGHAVAASQHRAGLLHWLDPERPPADLTDFAVEVEADAFAVALCFADLWGAHAGEAEATLRILAIRLTLNTMEAVEAASLLLRVFRHLPAKRRWNGIRSYLAERFPRWLLHRVDDLWGVLGEVLTFTEASAIVPPFEGILTSLRREGWIAGFEPSAEEEWSQHEEMIWHFRQPAPIVEFLIGADAVTAMPDLSGDVAATYRVGHHAVTSLLDSLPPWLTGSDPEGGQATSGELISYLRLRERWPPPFADGAPLPIHLMASAVHQRLNGRLPRPTTFGSERARGH